MEAAIKEALLWKETYPRSSNPYETLSGLYVEVGRYEEAIDSARETIQLNPDSVNGYVSLSTSYLYLNRCDEAKEIIDRAMAQGLDHNYFHYHL